MCRFFAYISPSEPCLLEDVLVRPKHSLAQQVHDHYLPHLLPHDPTADQEQDLKARNMLFNIDGLGIAWYTSTAADFEKDVTGAHPAVYKTTAHPGNDPNFRSICANTETRALFGHIRAASGTAIATVNNHPFTFGRHAFMHNGMVSDFVTIRRAICDRLSDAAYANVQGGTDSEHLAALYMTYLTASGPASTFEQTYRVEQMAAAMDKAVATVLQLQRELVGDGQRKPNSLNLCATDGKQLVSYRFRNHATSQPPSLYYSLSAGITLNRKYPGHPDGADVPGLEGAKMPDAHGEHLIVASEPSTYKMEDWVLIGKNQCLLAGETGLSGVRDVPYLKEWDAEDHHS